MFDVASLVGTHYSKQGHRFCRYQHATVTKLTDQSVISRLKQRNTAGIGQLSDSKNIHPSTQATRNTCTLECYRLLYHRLLFYMCYCMYHCIICRANHYIILYYFNQCSTHFYIDFWSVGGYLFYISDCCMDHSIVQLFYNALLCKCTTILLFFSIKKYILFFNVF